MYSNKLSNNKIKYEVNLLKFFKKRVATNNIIFGTYLVDASINRKTFN